MIKYMKNENSVKLSIIIPHYNSPDLITKLLDSIPNEPQVEVIVVDDHSTDKLEELASCKQHYGNRNIFFYNNEPGKKGAGTARNTGMKYAVGDYLLFADTDDWFMPDFFDSVKAGIINDAELVYYAPTSQKISGSRSNRHTHYAELVNNYLNDPTHQHELELRYLYWSPCSKVIKRSMVLENNLHFDETQFANDLMFSVQIGHLAKKISVSDKVIYCILEREGNLSSFRDEAATKMRQKVYYKYYFYMRKNLSWHDFRLLGFGLRSDYDQIKYVISIFLYEHRLRINKKGN